MSLIKGIHHVSMKCAPEAYGKVKAFYRDVLQMPLEREWDGGVMFSAGEGLIEIFPNAADEPGQGDIRHFALTVSDTDACVAAVRGAGYDVFSGPENVVIRSQEPLHARIAFCHGPCGEEIEFFELR